MKTTNVDDYCYLRKRSQSGFKNKPIVKFQLKGFAASILPVLAFSLIYFFIDLFSFLFNRLNTWTNLSQKWNCTKMKKSLFLPFFRYFGFFPIPNWFVAPCLAPSALFLDCNELENWFELKIRCIKRIIWCPIWYAFCL